MSPHCLIKAQKVARVDWCKFIIRKLNNGHSKPVYDIITGDETWIYDYYPGKKSQSKV